MSSSIRSATRIAWCGVAWHAALALCAVAFFTSDAANAQDKGTLNPEPLPPLAKPDDPKTPAKELFGRKTTPAPLQTRTIGFYPKAVSRAPSHCRSMARPGK